MFETLISEGLAGFAAQSYWEWIAAGFGIAYVILAAKESVWCWPSAFISTLIYTLLFWEGQLPMQSLLNAYYLMMAVYGWLQWKKPADKTTQLLHIRQKPWMFHLAFIGIGTALSLALAAWLRSQEASIAPLLDATVTVFSVMVTYLMVKKVLENWLYWIVIDSLAIILFWQNGYYATVIMFMLYLGLAAYGYWQWRQSWHSQQEA